MRTKLHSLAAAAAILAIASVACTKAPFSVELTDPLVKIFPADTVFKQTPDTAEYARGENAVLQLVVRADEDLNGVGIESVRLSCPDMKLRTGGVIGYVRSLLDYDMRDPDALLPEDRRYPDPVFTDSLVSIQAGTHRCFLADIDIPLGTKPGVYNAKLTINSDKGRKSVSTKIKVYPVSIEDQRLMVTNWMWVRPEFTNRGDKVQDGDSLWWEMYKGLVELARDYGNNAYRVNVASVGATPDGKNFSFDFSRFDREVEFLIEHGGLKEIHGEHMGGRSAWVAPFKFTCFVLDGKGGAHPKGAAFDDPDLKAYIDAYFPALVEHLKQKKFADGRSWLSAYRQFIADEPINENIEEWEAVARMIKAAAPEIKIIEAYRSSKCDRSLIDFPCPQEDELYWHECFHNLERSDSVWMYTCMYPREKYPNRFLDQLLIKTRLVHWINYSFNCIGYLHWGFNYWPKSESYWAAQGIENGPLDIVSTDEWPGGDSHIIYPGYRKYYTSIRLAAMRDGIRDYELLRMVEDRDSALAREFAGQIIRDLQDYETDPDLLRYVRHEMLEYLSK